MNPFDAEDEGRSSRLIPVLIFIGSAALAAAALRFAWQQPVVMAAVLGVVLAFAAARWLARRKLRRLLRSGDVRSVLQRWSPTLHRIPHPATMAPLMTATAFAAYGWVDKARAAMAAAERGPAWDAALEHRLFLDTLLYAFEGDRDAALERAGRLERLPLPNVRSPFRDRVVTLRAAAGALARAFAHQSVPGDRALLERASEASPLVFWAMRYAAAVVAIDEGELARVERLLANAPSWPQESTFRAFHDEIADRAGLPRPASA
ncbi:hypothetical protein AB3662_47205 [Sorangium cellulosum]|uniref:hypothetical protein n=1 Tax=Sorangium cellulosum TaxID=56 RepID=UPI003D9A3FAE